PADNPRCGVADQGSHARGACGHSRSKSSQGGLMDEVAARRWLVENRDVPRETLERLDRFEALLREENHRQNLVSAASLDRLWARHIVDSAQLLPLAPQTGRWLDLGTGAGFPGLVVAMLWPGETILIEQRR